MGKREGNRGHSFWRYLLRDPLHQRPPRRIRALTPEGCLGQCVFSSYRVYPFLVWFIGLEAYGLVELSSILACYLVSVRIGLKRSGINDSLVVHQLVTLVIGKGVEIIGFGVSDDLIRFDDLGLARCLLRLLDFVEDVLSHDVIIQLGFAFTVESETTHFAFDMTLLCLVPIILRTARHEFFNVIVGLQFTRKLAEVISQERAGLILFLLQVNDRIGVVVQNAFP